MSSQVPGSGTSPEPPPLQGSPPVSFFPFLPVSILGSPISFPVGFFLVMVPHTPGSAAARRDLAVGDHRLALFQGDAMPSPINLVADAVGDIRSLCQHQAHDAG